MVRNEIISVQEFIKNTLMIKNYAIQELIEDMVQSHGKMLRSRVFFESFGHDQEITQRQIKIAALIEMLHLATLVHDDIIDDAEIRRGHKSIQSKYDKSTAVYAGDFIFAKIFQVVASLEFDNQVEKLAKGVFQIFAGELMQHTLKYQYDIKIKDYLRIARGKTAMLFSLAAFLGAHESKKSEKEKIQYALYGHHLGMAFQVTDDVIDFISDVDKAGKNIFNDIEKGTFSLPIILSIKKSKANVEKWINEKSTDELLAFIDEYGIIEETRAFAVKYIEKSKRALHNIPRHDTKNLESILDALIDRLE